MRYVLHSFLLIASILTGIRTVLGQQRQIVFDTAVWNFGDVPEAGGSVNHTFVFTNPADKPVVVLDVSTGCGCTTPTYSRKPVPAGKQGEITVAFDPLNRPGHFSKGVSVLTSASPDPVILTVEGDVVPREKTVDELYPFDMGGGVRFSSNFRAFAYVPHGGEVRDTIGWINTSDNDVRLALTGLQSSGMLHLKAPESLGAGKRGTIAIRYAVPAESDRYGTLTDVLAVETDGRRSRTLVSVSAIAVDRFDPAVDDMSSPSMALSKKFIKFGEVEHGSVAEDASLAIGNEGDGTLIIRAVEFEKQALECSLKAGDTVEAGSSKPITLRLDTSGADGGVWVDRIKIITNDPERPMQTIRVTAIVVN